MKQHSWRVGFPISFRLVVMLDSVELSLMQWGWLHAYFVEWGSFSVIQCFLVLSDCVCILLKVKFEGFYDFWDYSKFLLLSFRKFSGLKGISHQKWISVFCHSGWVYGSILITYVKDPTYSVHERREMLQSVSAILHMYFWSAKWHIKTTRLSVFTETVFSNPCQKKYPKMPFFALWGKIAVLEYEGLSLGVKHSSWHGLHCYREACGSDWVNQLRAVWRTGLRLQGQQEVDVVIPGLKAEAVEEEDGLAGSVSTERHCK